MSLRNLKRFLLPVLLLVALLIPTLGQRPFDDFQNFRQRRRPQAQQQQQSGPSFGEYTFVRTIYDSPARGRRGYGYGYGGGT